VDVIPKKICTLDCVYCEAGPTARAVTVRKEYVSPDRVLAELRDALSRRVPCDWITFSGSGEPTLNSGLGRMIRGVKEMTDTPVAVITNGTLLSLPAVRADLLEADAVLPSLDAASPEVFERVNRPHRRLRVGQMIRGLRSFRREYRGQIWLEILLVRGVNDGDEEIVRLRDAIASIGPDKIQLNTVVRPPAEPGARPARRRRLLEVRSFLGERCEIISDTVPGDRASEGSITGLNPLLALLARRPVSLPDLVSLRGGDAPLVERELAELESLGLAERVIFNGVEYYANSSPRRLPAGGAGALSTLTK
jgi:wyosine [tRNA(Phe)-imidazoG37] synthetase (radical SAM superfamily)